MKTFPEKAKNMKTRRKMKNMRMKRESVRLVRRRMER